MRAATVVIGFLIMAGMAFAAGPAAAQGAGTPAATESVVLSVEGMT